MLIVTEPKYLYPNIDALIKNAVILNINANVTGFRYLCLTPPPSALSQMDVYSSDFDGWYVSQIFSSDGLFMNFMEIMTYLRNGRDVVLLVYRGSDQIDAMNEALLKLIQVRYGYNYQVVDSPDGINFYDTSGFSVPGILQFDMDDSNYRNLLIKYDLLNTNEYIDESHV